MSVAGASPPVAGLDRGTLRERLAAIIRTDIVAGVFKQGEQLRTETLVSRYNVSNTPVREALGVLASEGLVEMRTNRGAWVSQVTKNDAEGLLQVAALLNVTAYERGIPRLTDTDIALLSQHADEAMRAQLAGDVPRAMGCAHRIHDVVLSAAGNPELVRILRQIQPRLDRLVRMLYTADGSAERRGVPITAAETDHLAIVRALEAGHRDEAIGLVRGAWEAFVQAVALAPEAAFADQLSQ